MSKKISKLVFGISTASLLGLYCFSFAPSALAKNDKSNGNSGGVSASGTSGGTKTGTTSGSTSGGSSTTGTTSGSTTSGTTAGSSSGSTSGGTTTGSTSGSTSGSSSTTSTSTSSLKSFSSSDVGKIFEFNFDGNVETQNVSGLSSTALFTLKSFTRTAATFDVALDNTSSNGIKSRTSALGFNVYSDLGATNKLGLSGKTSVSGLFSNANLGGKFPNQFGDIDVCFTDGNTCTGGGNGGIRTDEGIGNFSFTLAFHNTVDSFALGNFGVRYQSIEGTSRGTSGTGRGKPRKVPEPGTTAALGLFAVGALGLKKKLQFSTHCALKTPR